MAVDVGSAQPTPPPDGYDEACAIHEALVDRVPGTGTPTTGPGTQPDFLFGVGGPNGTSSEFVWGSSVFFVTEGSDSLWIYWLDGMENGFPDDVIYNPDFYYGGEVENGLDWDLVYLTLSRDHMVVPTQTLHSATYPRVGYSIANPDGIPGATETTARVIWFPYGNDTPTRWCVAILLENNVTLHISDEVREEYPDLEWAPDEVTWSSATVMPSFFVMSEDSAGVLAEMMADVGAPTRPTGGRNEPASTSSSPETSPVEDGDGMVPVACIAAREWDQPTMFPGGESGGQAGEKGSSSVCGAQFEQCRIRAKHNYNAAAATCKTDHSTNSAGLFVASAGCCVAGAAYCAPLTPLGQAACCAFGMGACWSGGESLINQAYQNCLNAASSSKAGDMAACRGSVIGCCGDDGCGWVW